MVSIPDKWTVSQEVLSRFLNLFLQPTLKGELISLQIVIRLKKLNTI